MPDLVERLFIGRTVHDGYHLIYRCSTIEGNKVLSKNSNNKPLVETRGAGGYFMVAPTPGYEFIQGSPESIPTITPEERAELFNIAKCFDEYIPRNETKAKTAINTERLSPFEDYNIRADTIGLLEKHNWRNVKQKCEWIHFERPGKNKNSTSATYNTRTRIFYPFTSSTEFEPNKGYNAVGVYTTLKHLGDYSAASKQLYADGFGDRYTDAEEEPMEGTKEEEPTPLLPIEGFPKFVQDFINKCSEVYCTPRDYWAGAVLMASALGIGDKLELLTRYSNFPIFWIVLRRRVGREVSAYRPVPQLFPKAG